MAMNENIRKALLMKSEEVEQLIAENERLKKGIKDLMYNEGKKVHLWVYTRLLEILHPRDNEVETKGQSSNVKETI
jgi:hypothetical protein